MPRSYLIKGYSTSWASHAGTVSGPTPSRSFRPRSAKEFNEVSGLRFRGLGFRGLRL